MNNEKKYEKLTPFKMQVLESFPFIDADFDAITNYELLCKVVEYLNKTIANVDLLNEKVEEFQHYFDNLDVQEEINNKLDEMAESGELTEIIAQYLSLAGMLSYNTIADLKSAENLVNGSIVSTLGYHTVNDGGGATYKVRTVTNADTEDDATIIALHDESLVAELIFGNEIHTKQFGCYGDGTHDDTTNIQKAINYACNHHAILLFDNGKYIISNTLNIPSAIKIKGLYAKGDSTTSIKGAEIYISANNKTIFEFATGVSFYQCEIRNIRLNCNSENSGCIAIDTSKATFFSECILDTVYINGHFDKGIKMANTTITTIRNCVFSVNTIGIDMSVSVGGIHIQNCNFWNNTTDINATGALQHIYINDTNFENTINGTNMVFKAPISVISSNIYNCEFLSISSNYAILFDGSNSSGYVRLDGFTIENTSIAAKTGIKVDMTSNTAPNNALVNTYIKNTIFLRCTSYGLDTNYQNTAFTFIDSICYNNWYYGAGTLVNRTTNNRTKVYSFNNGLELDSTLNFKYASSLFYSANSLYLDSNSILKWRFTDTSKTAPIAMVQTGASTSRPSSPPAGTMYYDSTIGKPIWYTGSAWVDATGTQV